jgi:hypothetical protein
MKTTRKLSLAIGAAAVALTPFAVAVNGRADAAGGITREAAGQTKRSARPLERAVPAQPAAERESYAYGWPLKPFHRQHPVRGFFGDPRIADHGQSRQFHFGVDVSGANGTPVYTTLTGTASIHQLHPDVVLVSGTNGLQFSYWHVVPTIRNGQRVVAYETVIGHIEKPWAHVHFAEARNGVYLNPLRPGALGPFVDTTKPRSSRITTELDGRRISPAPHHPFDLVAQVGDETPLAVPRPWHDLPVMPALVRWRLLDDAGRPVVKWRTVIDFRSTIPDASEFDRIWAPGVTQNHVRMPAKYRVYLARSIAGLGSGTYTVEVAARDTRGNGSVTRTAIAVGSL